MVAYSVIRARQPAAKVLGLEVTGERISVMARSKRWRFGTILSIFSLMFVTVIASGGGVAASGSPTPELNAPPASAPLSDWQSWGNQETQLVHSASWAEIVRASGCTLKSLTYLPLVSGQNSAAVDMPAGVRFTAVAMVGQCPKGVTPLSSDAAQLPPQRQFRPTQ
jgi:hypothetical protein